MSSFVSEWRQMADDRCSINARSNHFLSVLKCSSVAKRSDWGSDTGRSSHCRTGTRTALMVGVRKVRYSRSRRWLRSPPNKLTLIADFLPATLVSIGQASSKRESPMSLRYIAKGGRATSPWVIVETRTEPNGRVPSVAGLRVKSGGSADCGASWVCCTWVPGDWRPYLFIDTYNFSATGRLPLAAFEIG